VDKKDLIGKSLKQKDGKRILFSDNAFGKFFSRALRPKARALMSGGGKRRKKNLP
jgi:hypothetical protein